MRQTGYYFVQRDYEPYDWTIAYWTGNGWQAVGDSHIFSTTNWRDTGRMIDIEEAK